MEASSHVSHSSRSSSSSSDSDDEEVAEVEVLLEVYFMHIDNTFNRLQVGRSKGCV
jgi:magnesium transporter